MLKKILAIPIILAGIAGLFLPMIPGMLLIAVGLFLLLDGKNRSAK